MTMTQESLPENGLELRSTISPQGRLDLQLETVPIGRPEPGEIVVRIEAAPVNPTDLGLLLGPGDPAQAAVEGSGPGRRLSIPLSDAQLAAQQRRIGLSLCPGMEGAGTVVAAGEGCADLLGRTVGLFGRGMYAQYRRVRAADCLLFPEGVEPARCAAAFVNPLTALGMVETLRREGHKAMIHTAAASNLGQMLNRLCIEDGIPLINIVRSAEQATVLRDIGARHILDSGSPAFLDELRALIQETGATLVFDAIGGGTLAASILRTMEQVFAPPPEHFSPYGSTVLKQVYVYGALDMRPIEVHRGAGMAWSVSGWLMMNCLAKLEEATVAAMKERIVRQIDSVFASSYTAEIGLGQLLDPQLLAACNRRSTGEKYLVNPSLG